MLIKDIQKIIPKVYQVGGSVRDELLGVTPKDYDYATPFTPDQIEQFVRDAGKRPYLVGKRFGTVGFKLDGQMIEVTSFRHERYFEGSRKPEVEFVKDITADLSRRDFTINAMAKTVGGRIIDPFGGIDDLEDGVIKCVGKPKDRFKEDPLRILRAARFASQLDFWVEEDTEVYMGKMRTELLHVSKERWCMELDKLLMTDDIQNGLTLLIYNDIFNVLIPELSLQIGYDQNSKYHSKPLWEHTLIVTYNMPKDINLRWAALLHDVGKPFTCKLNTRTGYNNFIDHEKVGAEIVEKTGLYLKRSNDWIKTVKSLVLNHMKEDSPLKEADDKAK